MTDQITHKMLIDSIIAAHIHYQFKKEHVPAPTVAEIIAETIRTAYPDQIQEADEDNDTEWLVGAFELEELTSQIVAALTAKGILK